MCNTEESLSGRTIHDRRKIIMAVAEALQTDENNFYIKHAKKEDTCNLAIKVRDTDAKLVTYDIYRAGEGRARLSGTQ